MESEEFDSIGGLVIGELGRFPEQNEEVNILTFFILFLSDILYYKS